MVKQVEILASPDLLQKPRVDFRGDDFNAINWTKGYDVIVEQAVKCPCKSKDNDQLSICQNCLGVGWVFINNTQDRAILTSVNFDTQYKEWSELKIGTANITLQRRSYLAYMDRITVVDSQVVQSEVIYPQIFGANYFAYTIYSIDDIVEVFAFLGPTEALQLMVEDTDYTVERNKILLTYSTAADVTTLKAVTGYQANDKYSITSSGSIYNFNTTSTATPDDDAVILPDDSTGAGRWLKLVNFSISVRYWHKLQYHVLDIPHVIRNSYKKNELGRDELQLLPVQGIARLSHYVVDALNFAGDNIFNNSYST